MDVRWPILRLVIDLRIPLSEIEKWDLDDIRHVNSILDMRQDCESAADAYQMEETRKSTAKGDKR